MKNNPPSIRSDQIHPIVFLSTGQIDPMVSLSTGQIDPIVSLSTGQIATEHSSL